MSKKANRTIDLDFLQEASARTDLSGMFAASVATESEMHQAVMVKIDRLLNNPYQPRLETNDESIEELAQVIKAQGYQGVLIGRPDPVNKGFYQLTAGHRRREAAKRAGLSALPLVVRELTNEEMITLAITENIQREDLTALEEGKIYLLMSDEMGYTHEQIAREVGKRRGYIENRIRVARAPRDVQALVQARPDTLRAVSYLVKVKDDHWRAEIIGQLMASTLTADDIPGYIQAQKERITPKEVKAASSEAKANRHEDEKAASPLEEPAPTAMAPTAPDLTVAALEASSPMEPAQLHRVTHGGEPTEHNLTRIGDAKLTTILRYINTYKDQSAGRASISTREQAGLARIKTVVEELYARYCVEEHDKQAV